MPEELPDEPRPVAFARVGDALLLEDGFDVRALWRGEPARAFVFDAGLEDAALTAGVALAVAAEARSPNAVAEGRGSPICDVHFAGYGPGAHTVIVLDDRGGCAITDLIEAHPGSRAFPVDVACRVALAVLSMTSYLPTIPDVRVDWHGRVRASPVPRIWMGRFASQTSVVRFLSPEEARGERTSASTAVYRAGAVLFELLTGTSPLPADMTGSAMNILFSIISSPRIPLLQKRDSPSDRPLVDDARRALGRFAAGADDAARFLAGHVAHTFPEERARALSFWEQAAMLASSPAPPWTSVPCAPVPDVAAALRTMHTRSARTD
jgi:serine/threonine protein kinase